MIYYEDVKESMQNNAEFLKKSQKYRHATCR